MSALQLHSWDWHTVTCIAIPWDNVDDSFSLLALGRSFDYATLCFDYLSVQSLMLTFALMFFVVSPRSKPEELWAELVAAGNTAVQARSLSQVFPNWLWFIESM